MADAPRKRPPGPGRGNRVPQGSGMPASDMPAMGAGWGGPANGTGAGRIEGARNRATIRSKADRAERMVERLEHLAEHAEHEMTQVQAARAAYAALAPSADALLAAQTAGTIARAPVTPEEWAKKHGAEADMGAAAGTATRAN